MPSHLKPVSRPWRRYLRFSLRGLILLVMVVGAGLGWIVRQAHIQRDAVAAITKAGGEVAYKWDHGKAILGGRSWPPSWVVESIGVDFFGHVYDVRFNASSGPPDTVFAEVGRLNRLQKLWLNGTSATDAGLVHLKGLSKLWALDLGGTRVTDAGLAELKGLTELYALCLDDTHVTDAGLAHLKGLTNLHFIELFDTKVTDAGVKDLQQAMPSLNFLR